MPRLPKWCPRRQARVSRLSAALFLPDARRRRASIPDIQPANALQSLPGAYLSDRRPPRGHWGDSFGAGSLYSSRISFSHATTSTPTGPEKETATSRGLGGPPSTKKPLGQCEPRCRPSISISTQHSAGGAWARGVRPWVSSQLWKSSLWDFLLL